MDLENYKCPNLASLEDDEETKNIPVLENFENVGASEIDTNGSDVEYNHSVNDLRLDHKGKEETEASVSVTLKGYGLKKWRRIKRDVVKGGRESIDNAGTIAVHELSNLVMNPSKRTQVYDERQQQKSEGSVSSPKPLVGNFSDAFALYGETGFSMGGPSVDDRTGSEDYSSKSSTAASVVPKVKTEIPVVVGFSHDKNKTRHSLSGKNLTHSLVQRGQRGKGRNEATKKARGEWLKIDKENSQSSMESDLRSSNFVFMQGTYETSNGGTRSEGRENSHEVRGSEWRFSEGLEGGYGRNSEGGYEDKENGDLKEIRENHGSSTDQDSLVESIFLLQKAQEVLGEEVLKFKEIGKDASVDGFLSDTQADFTEVGIKGFEQFPSGENLVKCSRTSESEMLEIAKRDVEAQLEYLFKQRIEAEVEYLALSRTVQKLNVTAVDQRAISEEQNSTTSGLAVNELGDKATTLMEEADKLQNYCEDIIVNADETLALQRRMCKYASYFLVQLLSLLIVVGVFIFRLSPNHVEVVPT